MSVVKRVIRPKKAKERNKLETEAVEVSVVPRIKKVIRTHSLTHPPTNMRRSCERKMENDREKYNEALNKIRVTWVNSEEKEEEILEKGKKGKEIAVIISALNSNIITDDYEIELIPLVDVNHFNEAVEIYENNQQYWLKHLKTNKKSINELNKLEEWFILILEPMPETDNEEEIEYWKEKELHKTKYWQSIYCLEELKNIVKVENKTVQRKLLELFKNFKIS